MAAAGLQTQIWNNNAKSVILLALYPVIIGVMVWLCAYAFASAQGGFHMEGHSAPYGYVWVNTGNPEYVANNFIAEFWSVILTVIAVWFLISYFFNTAMIRKLSHARTVTRQEEPELYNLLENLCIAQGMTMPKLNIIETHARNAFASGIDEKSYTITVTRGLLNSLQKDEVEAVLGHELSHIINRDVRLLMVTIVFTGMIGLAAQLVWSSIRYNLVFGGGRRRDKNGNAVFIALAIALILWAGYMATLFMRFALSRRREYMADAGSIRMTKNPDAMMRALMRIAGRDRLPEATEDVAMMCIENAHAFMGLFATHPPIGARIKTISEMTRTPIPQLPHTGPAPAGAQFGDRSRKNPWLIARRGR